jgi:NDP-4-keto-2,6-dideoxyhexose 3-C-methyltransferase
MQKLNKCRVCGSRDLKTVINLGVHPFSGYFPTSESVVLDAAPLELVKCCDQTVDCNLVQLGHILPSESFYNENYGYRSGLNGEMISHLANNIHTLEKFAQLKEKDMVLDIGSNDGTSLRQYTTKSLLKVGVDPTAENFRKYYENDVTILPEIFTFSSISNFCEKNGKKFKAISSFSMFYDLPDPIKFARDIYKALDDNGVWMLEQSDLHLMLANNSIDTVCHEHLEYYSFSSIQYVLKKTGFKIVDVSENTANGGSLRIVVAKAHSK